MAVNNLREVAQQALKAMEKATRYMSDADYKKLNESIEALRAALAEPAPWIGLTDDERAEITSRKWWDFEDEFDVDGFARAIEGALKEKNKWR